MSLRYQAGILGAGFNPLQAPNAPTIGAATAGSTQVSVAFTAPANVGGSSISSYAVRVSPGGFSATGSTSPITVSGLTNGTTYTFSVAALNSYGPSPYSGTVTATPTLFAVEDYFSTYLYTGNGSTQTITNGLNLSGQGGLVWTKRRVNTTYGNTYHIFIDTVRGANKQLYSNGTDAQATNSNMITSFNADGYSIGSDGNVNYSGSEQTYVSWAFREAPKFFDVVTYTGNGTTNGTQAIAHSLGITPGCIIIKRLDSTSDWFVYNVGSSINNVLRLNTTAAASSISWTSWGVTSTTFTPFSISGSPDANVNGATYVAYLFAHDATSDGIIQCGSYTGNGTSVGPAVNLGWEPQWILIKRANVSTGQWEIYDSMRGLTSGGNEAILRPNTADPEFSTVNRVTPTATGFFASDPDGDVNASGSTYIYIAIRRGPMKTPTLGTSVYESVAYSGNNTSNRIIGSTTLMDMILVSARNANTPAWSTTYAHYAFDRLRGDNFSLATSKTDAEIGSWSNYIDFDLNTGWDTGPTIDYAYLNGSATNYLSRSFKRAPGFFDVVCYTGNGTFGPRNHNLGVVPELIITKQRSASSYWSVWRPNGDGKEGVLNTNAAWTTTFGPGYPSATTTTFDPGWDNNNVTVVTYLFASCPGVSKVGSYTGNGSSQTINCGFSSAARFILIKRTDSTGDWYTWDAATGLVAGNDPHLSLNTADAEVTTDDSVDTDSTGFIVNQNAATNINVNGGTYIFLAIS